MLDHEKGNYKRQAYGPASKAPKSGAAPWVVRATPLDGGWYSSLQEYFAAAGSARATALSITGEPANGWKVVG